MHSFSTVSALLAAALATFTNAAPISVPVLPAVAGGQVSGVTNLVSGVTAATPVNGVVKTVEGDVNTLAGGVVSRDIKSTVESAVEAIDAKITARQTVSASVSGTPGVAAIFTGIMTQIQPLTTELTFLTPSNCTVASVTNIVSSIKTPISAAVPQLQALAGQPLNVIMAAADGSNTTLSVSQVAAIVAPVFSTILSAAGSVVNIAGVQQDVTGVLTDLTSVVSTLLSVVISLVGGILSELTPILSPVLSTVSGAIGTLGLNYLTGILGITGLNL